MQSPVQEQSTAIWGQKAETLSSYKEQNCFY